MYGSKLDIAAPLLSYCCSSMVPVQEGSTLNSSVIFFLTYIFFGLIFVQYEELEKHPSLFMSVYFLLHENETQNSRRSF